jgi:Fur family transcriptional regulator, ferric uptake regulator
MGTVLITITDWRATIIERVPRRTRKRTDWSEHARAELRRAGHRSGGARTAVIDLMADQDCCLSAQEIFDRLRADGRVVGIASIYRALELLTRLGLVRRVDMGSASGYEPASPEGDHHHHVVCERCGKVSSFEDQALEDAIDRLSRRLRHTVAEHDVVLRGNCPDCR